MQLSSIEQPVQPLLDRYHHVSQKLLHSDVQLIQDITRHLYTSQGKELRPLLTLLSSACCGLPVHLPDEHPIFHITAAIELLHNATLLHDDVVDQSALRRGQPTVNQLWNNRTAVLMGDYFLSQVMQILFQIDNPDITDTISHTVTQMSEGELLQQQCSGDLTTDTDTYLRIIRQKTALLLSSCCRVGALLASNQTQYHDAATDFGLQIGIAFQIRDDLLDFLPSSTTGKPQGNDLREHKITLPVILAIQKTKTHNNNPLATLSNKEINDNEVQTLISFIAQSGALRQCVTIQERYLSAAKKALQLLPSNSFRDAMDQLTDQLRIDTDTLIPTQKQ